MSNKNLFKEAIADAKAVREAALANAKVALEEALTPKLQSMLAAKLQEMDLNEDEESKETKELNEKSLGQDTYRTDDVQHVGARERHAALEEADELEEDFDLSEILAELNEDDSKEKTEYEELEEADEEKEEEEEEEEEEEVKDMTIEDLKNLIRDIVSQEIGDEEPSVDSDEEPMGMSGEEMPAAGGDEDEIDLEELLAELDSLDEAKEKETKEDKKKKMKKEKMNENLEEGIGSFLDKLFNLGLECVNTYDAEVKAAGDDKQAKRAAYSKYLACMKQKAGGVTSSGSEVGASAMGGKWSEFGKAESQDELAEAIETINTLRNELNEVNLLNAKLLYVNKIFKAKNLTESQKVKVIASFDKATNVKEAKVVFESLQTALTAAPKTQIKESLGFASKAAGVAPNKTIVESNDVIARMQKLANIK